MTTILILEISATGHHPRFVRHVLRSVEQEGVTTLIAGLPNLIQHKELDPVRNRFTPFEIALSKKEKSSLNDFSTFGLIRRQFCIRGIYARVWREITKTRDIDYVVVPFVDDCVYALSSIGSPFGKTPWVAVTMRTQFHFSRVGVTAPKTEHSVVREALFGRLLKQPSLKVLLTIDPTLIHFSRRQRKKEFAKLQYLPDPCENLTPVDKMEARKSLDLPLKAKVILIYGLLSERKGVFNLLRAMSLPECPKNVHVVLAGSQDDGVKAFLTGPAANSLMSAKRLHMKPGYVPRDLVAQLVYACDAMWIGYIDFYTMSGVLVTAGRHGLPAITCEQGIVGYLSRSNGCGLPVDPRSDQSILAALQRVSCGDPELARVSENAFNLFSAHSHAEFYRIFGNAVRSTQRGQDPTPNPAVTPQIQEERDGHAPKVGGLKPLQEQSPGSK